MSLLLDALQRARQTGDADVAVGKSAPPTPSIDAPDWTLDPQPSRVKPEAGTNEVDTSEVDASGRAGMAARQDTPQAGLSAEGMGGRHAKSGANGASTVVGGVNLGVASTGATAAPVSEAADRRRAAQRIVAAVAPVAPSPRGRVVVWAGIGGAALVLAAGVGWWVWDLTRPVSIVAQAPTMPAATTAQGESTGDPAAPATSGNSTGPAATEPPSAEPRTPVMPTPADTAAASTSPVATPSAARSDAPREVPPRRVARPTPAPAVASASGSVRPAPVQPGGGNTPSEAGALRIERDGWPQWLSQAQAAAASGDWALALERYTAVLAQRPSEPQALLGQAVALHRLQRWPAALQAYERVLQVMPQQADARYGWAVVLARVDPDRAEREMQEWLLQQPADSGVWLALGMLYGRQGRWGLSAQALQRAVDIEPQRVEAVFNWAVALDHAGRVSEAIAAYRRALALPLDATARAQAQPRLQQLNTAQSEGVKADERGG